MRNRKSTWFGLRSAQTLDSVGGGRSEFFAAYLAGLPEEERQRIVAAESAYVNRVNDPNSVQRSTLRDFDEGMMGVREDQPVEHRGFTI